MFSTQPLLVLFLTLAMELGLTACGAEFAAQPGSEAPELPAQVQETPEPAPDPATESPESGLEVTVGTETYRGFRMDNVLHAPEGDIHYHIYIPDSYDGSEAYALFLTLSGYEGLYFQGVGENLYSERFAFEALNYNGRMIVAAPQLGDWGDTSAEQAIALTEYLLGRYNIDRERVYAEGYSGGGDLLNAELSPAGRALTLFQCLHYALTRPGVASVMSGARNLEELKTSIAYEDAPEAERDYAAALAALPRISWVGHCMYCGHCAPCPVGIDVAGVTKFLNLARAQGEVPETVREHYAVLPHHGGECISCGACERRCPFGVPVMENMRRAAELFGM